MGLSTRSSPWRPWPGRFTLRLHVGRDRGPPVEERLETAVIVVSVITLLVGMLSAMTYQRIAMAADERKLQSLDRVGRGLIAAARVCAILVLVLTAAVILTS